MTETSSLVQELNQRFIKDFPADAAQYLETRPVAGILPLLQDQPASVLIPVWSKLVPIFAASLTEQLPAELSKEVLTGLAPDHCIRILKQMDEEQSNQQLEQLDAPVRNELSRLMSYPENSAGQLMDPRVPSYRASMTVEATRNSLRGIKMKTARSLFIINDEGLLKARVLMQDLALAEPSQTLEALSQPVTATVSALTTQEEIADIFSKYTLFDLPVIDLNGVLLGVIVHANLLQTVQDNSSANIQTMVGVSREERALSTPFFAVKKRMPWLQINLLTAFLAAAVVGIFENTIAQFTALAILLPVVAGQSGNAGAQALAVTMRGLALREITIRHWFIVMFKEVRVGFLNGLCIALTCGIGVFIWSGSLGLVVVISVSMVLAMVAAGFAGAVVPIVLVRLGQDPAQSSSIILTTVTDVAGFFSFLGIATLLMNYL